MTTSTFSIIKPVPHNVTRDCPRNKKVLIVAPIHWITAHTSFPFKSIDINSQHDHHHDVEFALPESHFHKKQTKNSWIVEFFWQCQWGLFFFRFSFPLLNETEEIFLWKCAHSKSNFYIQRKEDTHVNRRRFFLFTVNVKKQQSAIYLRLSSRK